LTEAVIYYCEGGPFHLSPVLFSKQESLGFRQ
jgi:hypothetical protein